MTYETFRLYQTLAQDGVPYPTEPSAPDMDAKIEAAPSVWYVKELVNPKYDVSLVNPTITATDTGKRFNLFAMGNGACLGGPYQSTNGVTRAYLQEGTYLMGFWYNGQLFGVPLTFGDTAGYYVSKEVNVVEEIINEELPDPIPCVPSEIPSAWEITISNWPGFASPYLEDRTVVLPLYEDAGRHVVFQYEEEDGDNTKRWRVYHDCIGFVGGGGGESLIFGYGSYNTESGIGSPDYSGYWLCFNPQPGSPYYDFMFGSNAYGTMIRGVKLF